MLKISVLLIILVDLFLFKLSSAFAETNVVINEIMYDFTGSDDNHEWIELVNLGSDSADLTSWRFEESGAQHTLTLKQGSLQLGHDGYAVIADNADQFLADNQGFSDTLIDSSFSLSNSGESLKIKDSQNGVVVNEITYSSDWGAAGDSNSLQRKSDGSWISAAPTPGQSNAIDPVPSPSPSPSPTSSSSSQTSSSSSSKSPSPAPAKSSGSKSTTASPNQTGTVLAQKSQDLSSTSTSASLNESPSPSPGASPNDQESTSKSKVAGILVGSGVILIGLSAGFYLWYKKILEGSGEQNKEENL